MWNPSALTVVCLLPLFSLQLASLSHLALTISMIHFDTAQCIRCDVHVPTVMFASHMCAHRTPRHHVITRVPRGSYEWDGAWGDKSKEWTTYKNIAKKLKQKDGGDDDGVFWMP
jgi:hypothetical protein